MFNKLFNIFNQKSPKQRFLFVLGLLMISSYYVLASIFIFWKTMPVTLPYNNRLIFGIVLAIYGTFRFYRFLNHTEEE